MQNKTNIWGNSTLNTSMLNGTYLSGFSSTWQNKIATSSWKVGGNTYSNITRVPAKTAYQNEIVSPAESTTYSAKIGLMYVSDYYYATISTYWNYSGYNDNENDYRLATEDNWLYFGSREWTISRSTDRSDRAFFVNDGGTVAFTAVQLANYVVRPCFYLNSNITYISGSGTSSDPILIN